MRTRAIAVHALILALGASSTGCMSLVRGTARGYDLAPNGMSRADDGFRRALVVGAFAGAYARSASPKTGAPHDPLLRDLYRGLTAFYAGRFDETADAFARADQLTERRITKSLSRAAASIVTNDGVLPYVPTRTEQLFVRYYAMHTFLRSGRMEDAVVEARRLGRQLEDAAPSLAPGERALHATMRDAAGAVFEAAGERNDALVSYRNAALLRGVDRRDVDSISLRPPGPDSATLVVFIESGFVAHRVDRGLTIGLGGTGGAWQDTMPGGPSAVADSMFPPAPTAEGLTARALRMLDELPDGGVFAGGPFALGDHSRGRGGYRVNRPMRIADGASSFVRVAWPALARPTGSIGAIALLMGGRDAMNAERSLAASLVAERPVAAGADVTEALAEDFRRDRAMILTRSIARALAKGALSEALRERHGDWAGTLASLAGTALERADTRSWHLLPGAVRVVRLTVPAGTHAPSLKVGTDVEALTLTLPAVSLGAGETRVLSTRIWRDGSAFSPPVAATAGAAVTDDSTGRRPDR